mmetsp:Transcript_6989/g.16131  ORF Transcript_6989/g.16131 Transcript_6989/m.16131 type:complete len:662 (-) Transcript_6989:682-2667(-)
MPSEKNSLTSTVWMAATASVVLPFPALSLWRLVMHVMVLAKGATSPPSPPPPPPTPAPPSLDGPPARSRRQLTTCFMSRWRCMYSVGSFGTALGISALGVKLDRISSRTLALGSPDPDVPAASLALICSDRRPRMTSRSSSLGFMGRTAPAGAASDEADEEPEPLLPCMSAMAGGTPAPTAAAAGPGPVSRLSCSRARLSAVMGTVSLLYPSSPAVSPPPRPPPKPDTSDADDDLLLLSLGVGVARRALTLPAVGRSSRPLLSTADTLDRADDVETPDTSLPDSLTSSPPPPLLRYRDALLDASSSPLVTPPSALSTLAFQCPILLSILASPADTIRNMRVYFRSLRTSIPSRTLLHFLMTSRRPRKVVSSLSAPRVAVSMATSSTSARRKSRLPKNSKRTLRRSHSAWDSCGVVFALFASSLISSLLLPSPPMTEGMPSPPTLPSPLSPSLGGGLLTVHPPASYASLTPTASSWNVLSALGALLGSRDVPHALPSWYASLRHDVTVTMSSPPPAVHPSDEAEEAEWREEPPPDDDRESPSLPPRDDDRRAGSSGPFPADDEEDILRDLESDLSDRPTLASMPRDRPRSGPAGLATECCGALPADGRASPPLWTEPPEPRLFPPDDSDPPSRPPLLLLLEPSSGSRGASSTPASESRLSLL